MTKLYNFVAYMCLSGWIICCVEVNVSWSADIPSCSEPEYQYNGYTYSVRESDAVKMWTHCNFIHPHTDKMLCGITRTWSDVYLCDPDGLLLEKQEDELINSAADQVSEDLHDVVSAVRKECPKNDPVESIVIAVVVLKSIHIGSATNANRCLNDCGVPYPQLKNTSITSGQDLVFSADVFTKKLIIDEWKIGQCNNQLAILYVAEYNKVWIYSGDAIIQEYGDRLADDLYSEIKEIIEQRDNSTTLGEALRVVAEVLKNGLQHNEHTGSLSPALTLLVTTLTGLFVLALVLILVIFIRKSREP